MDFVTYLAVNALLFLRPQELVPELERAHLYYFAMLGCLAFSFVHLMQLVFYSPLFRHPTVILCYLMLVLAGISLAVKNDLGKAIEEEIEFVKVIVYFTLFLAVVRTPARLRVVTACVVVCMMVTAIISVSHFYGVIHINLKFQEEMVMNPATGQEEAMRRLRFTGILNDPNEVAVFLSMLGFLCLYQFSDKKQGATRLIWLAPILLFLVCIFLTRSRGGLLALITGIAVYCVYRFRNKTVAIGALALIVPVVLVAFGGRQTQISANANTAQTRFGLWSDWLQEFRYNPIIGVGPEIATKEAANENQPSWGENKHCAHNSYLQPFADMGFLGGLCFLGAMGFGLITVHRYGFDKTVIYDPDLARFQPYLIAAMASYAMGCLSLSLNYVIPTFFVMALPVAYYGMTPCYPPIRRPTLTAEVWARLGLASLGFLVFTYAIVRVMPKQ